MPIRTVLLLGCAALSTILGALPARAGDSSEALRVARESQPRWTIGALRVREKHGRVRVQAPLIADGAVIARLRLDPTTGAFTADEAEAAAVDREALARLKAAATRALPRLEVGGWAWPAERGRTWRVPLRYEGRAVGTIAVDVGRNRLVARERDESEGEE